MRGGGGYKVQPNVRWCTVYVPACLSVSVGVGLRRPRGGRGQGRGLAVHLLKNWQPRPWLSPTGDTESAPVHLDPEQVERGINNGDLPF